MVKKLVFAQKKVVMGIKNISRAACNQCAREFESGETFWLTQAAEMANGWVAGYLCQGCGGEVKESKIRPVWSDSKVERTSE